MFDFFYAIPRLDAIVKKIRQKFRKCFCMALLESQPNPSFLSIFVFSIHCIVLGKLGDKSWDSNCESLVSKATALPTTPQPRPWHFSVMSKRC